MVGTGCVDDDDDDDDHDYDFAWRDTPGARHAREDTRPDSMHPMNRIYIFYRVYTSAQFSPRFHKTKQRSFAKKVVQK